MLNNFYGDISAPSITKIKSDYDSVKNHSEETQFRQQVFLEQNSREAINTIEDNDGLYDYSDDEQKSIKVNNIKPEGDDLIQDNNKGATKPEEEYSPKFLPLIKQQYSLESDMIFGWIPKVAHAAPVPLTFEDRYLDILLYNIEEKQRNYLKYEIVYHGLRPNDTFKLHKLYSGEKTYPFRFGNILFAKHQHMLKLLNEDQNYDSRGFVGMNPKYQIIGEKVKKKVNYDIEKKGIHEKNGYNTYINNENSNGSVKTNYVDCHKTIDNSGIKDTHSENNLLIFDSNFESGNLDTVLKTGDNEYDLFMRVDSNTRGHTSWYYFKVTGMKKNQKVKFNIMNFSKPDSLYKRGKKPYIYSEMQNKLLNYGWHQNGENLTYKLSQFGSHEDYYRILSKKKRYWKLSFEYIFSYDDDEVYFALCIPYTYSDLLKLINTLLNNPENQIKNFIKQTSLCLSLSGIDVPILNITDYNSNEIPQEQRDIIICTGRVHPGESNGSWMIHGFLEWICGDSKEAKQMRSRFIIKVIPMLNPDGVIFGNHRTGICGCDLNRQYLIPDERLHPTISSTKRLIAKLKLKSHDNIFAYIDFHGHSLRKNVFMYGAEFPLHNNNYYRVRILPKIMAKNTEMFRYAACLFRISHSKIATSRAVFSQQYGIAHCYTLEASYASYLDAEKKTLEFDEKAFIKMGAIVGKSLYQYQQLLEEEKEAKRKRLERKRIEKLIHEQKLKSEIMAHPLSGSSSLNDNNTTSKLLGSNEDKIKFYTPKIKKNSMVKSDQDVHTNKMSQGFIENPNEGSGQKILKYTTNILSSEPSEKTCEISENFNGPCLTGMDLSVEKNPFSSTKDFKTSEKKIKSKKKKHKNNMNRQSFKKSKEHNKKYELEDESEFCGDDDISINHFLKEIKIDVQNKKNKKKEDSDDISEGQSDSESSDNDFDEEEKKKLHRNILKKIDAFAAFLKNDFKQDLKKIKKPSKSVILSLLHEQSLKNNQQQQPLNKKKSITHCRNISLASNLEINDNQYDEKNKQKIENINKNEPPSRGSINKIGSQSPIPDVSPIKGVNNLFKIRSTKPASNEKERFVQTTKHNDSVHIAHNLMTDYMYNKADLLSSSFSIVTAKVRTLKFENETVKMKYKRKPIDHNTSMRISEQKYSHEAKYSTKNSESNGIKSDKELYTEQFGDKSRPNSNVNSTKLNSNKMPAKLEEILPPGLNKLYNKLHTYFGRKGHFDSTNLKNGDALGACNLQNLNNTYQYTKKFSNNNNNKSENYDNSLDLSTQNDFLNENSSQYIIPNNLNHYLLYRGNSNDYGVITQNYPNVKLEPIPSYSNQNDIKEIRTLANSPAISSPARKKLPNSFESYRKMISKKKVEQENFLRNKEKAQTTQNIINTINNNDSTKRESLRELTQLQFLKEKIKL